MVDSASTSIDECLPETTVFINAITWREINIGDRDLLQDGVFCPVSNKAILPWPLSISWPSRSILEVFCHSGSWSGPWLKPCPNTWVPKRCKALSPTGPSSQGQFWTSPTGQRLSQARMAQLHSRNHFPQLPWCLKDLFLKQTVPTEFRKQDIFASPGERFSLQCLAGSCHCLGVAKRQVKAGSVYLQIIGVYSPEPQSCSQI